MSSPDERTLPQTRSRGAAELPLRVARRLSSERARGVILLRDMLLARGRTVHYGPDRSQRADLYVPAAPGSHPVMVLIHGRSWSKRYGRIVMRALAQDVLTHGWAIWNIEYRRLGNGGG